MKNPIRETDNDARKLAQGLMAQARVASLATLPEAGVFPMVTRVALTQIGGQLYSLISDLAAHSRALQAKAACSLLIGEPGEKGDPLVHPRMTVYAHTRFLKPEDKESLRTAYLERHPKAGLYYNFADFRLVRFDVDRADLNGGFGKAYQLSASDLGFD